MKSSTRLDSVVFQLTPTRTRCDLVIIADGKTEKIASGLLNPFLAHLKVAQEQIGKGGYSIILEPNHGSDAAWFSKGTVERFVRFVSTPEILERVYTIESEILQIEEATSFQISNETGLHNVEDHQVKSKEINEGGKPILGNNEEKAIVLYKPDVHPPEAEGSTMQEGNSKVQLLKVLGARKRVLQKEQGMAFARAVAAGFDIDHIKPLMSFAECFGASRMMDACSRFIDLWNAKHENGQWLEIEAAEAMSCRSDLPPAHSGIMISNLSDKKKELKESWPQGEASSENNGPSSMTANPDIKPPVGHQVPPHPHEYIPDQFSHPMFPSWPINPQANPLPIFLQYPMPMPYYQNYPGNGPLFQPPYPIIDESTLHTGQRMGQRRHSMDNSELSTESETQEVDALKRKTQDDMDKNEEDSRIWEARKKSGKSSQNQSGMVVIRNINYITSKKQSSGGGDSQSSASEAEEDRNLEFSAPADMNKSSPSNSKRKGCNIKSTDALKTLDNENRISGHTTDDSHWEAFQNFLLRDTDEDNNSSKRGMLAMEGKEQGRKRQSTNGEDPSVLGGRGLDGLQNGRYSESHDISRDITRMLKPTNDEMLTSRRGKDFGHNIRAIDAHMAVGLTEMGYHGGACRRVATAGDELMIHEREKLTVVQNLDPLFGNRLDASYNQTRSSTHNTVDESFVVPCRSSSFGQVGGGDGRSAIDVDFELPSLLPGAENHTDRTGSQGNYEPNDLNLMPNRVTENFPIGFDPAMDYEKQDFNGNATKVEAKKEVTLNSKRGSRKEDKEHRLKAQKKITATTIKRKPYKLSPSDEARARAERLRAFKADLQKLKKAKEEEQIKRIEDLKIERQKRIAARSNTNPSQSSLPTQKTRAAKLSPSSHKGSKFSDTEHGPSSPLQRSTITATSKASANSIETYKPGRLNNSGVNKLSRSTSSLGEPKKENNSITPDPKATMARIRRLSEPKSSGHHASSVSRSVESVPRRRISNGPDMKKMSAITNLDKTKSATLLELKIRTFKGSADVAQKEPSTKDVTQKMNRNTYSNASASVNPNESNGKTSSQSDRDDNTVVEKTVVMLECGKPSIPVAHAPEEKISIQNLVSDVSLQEGKVKESAVIQAPASVHPTKEIGQESTECQQKGKSHFIEAGTANCEKVLPNISSISITEEPYQAPYARISSLEDPCTVKSKYGKALPMSLELATAGVETNTVHIPDSHRKNLDNMLEASNKPMRKESSKGLRGLLKFGKKNHNSTTVESNAENDKASLDDSKAGDDTTCAGVSGEVYTLKNLISVAETGSSSSTTPQKSSRTFSLFSPFKSKAGERRS